MKNGLRRFNGTGNGRRIGDLTAWTSLKACIALINHFVHWCSSAKNAIWASESRTGGFVVRNWVFAKLTQPGQIKRSRILVAFGSGAARQTKPHSIGFGYRGLLRIVKCVA